MAMFAGAQIPSAESLGGKTPTFVRPVPLEQRHVGYLPGIFFIPGP